MGSELGIPDDKILALEGYATRALDDERERVALQYADATLCRIATSTRSYSSACEAFSAKTP